MKILKADIEYILKSTHISRSEMFENKGKSIFGRQKGRCLPNVIMNIFMEIFD